MSEHYEITRLLEFDAGHRLLGHESKCRNNHGHRYKMELTVRAKQLDVVGRVIDYSVLKEEVGSWIDENLDHGYIGEHGDVILAATKEAGLKTFAVDFPPTSENLARFLFDLAKALLEGHPIEVVKVRLYETPNCWADWPGTGAVRININQDVR